MAQMRHILTLFLLLWAFGAQGVSSAVGTPQGAVWRLRESGMDYQADEAEKVLVKILETYPVTEMAHLGGGVSSSYLVRFPGKIFAVLKRADPDFRHSYMSEVAAYRLDKLLGLHLVPLTVMREIEGVPVSLQLYYTKGVRGDARENDLESRRADAQLFDYLIANQDRNFSTRHNLILGKDGRLIAIDHGRSFSATRYAISKPLEMNLNISSEFKERLMAVTAEDITKELKHFVPQEELVLLLNRLNQMKQELAVKKSSAQPYRIFDPIDKIRPFEAPEELRSVNYYDFYAILRIVPEIGGDHLSAEALDLIKKTSASEGKTFLVRLLLNRWENYSKSLKQDILKNLWSPGFERQVIEHRSSALLEIMKLNAERPASEFPPQRHFAPFCAKILL